MGNFFQEFKVATDEICRARWCCGKPGERFRCYYCGRKFAVGDEFKAIYTNDIPGAGGNPLICKACFDEIGGEIKCRERWQEVHKHIEKLKVLYWWHRGLNEE